MRIHLCACARALPFYQQEIAMLPQLLHDNAFFVFRARHINTTIIATVSVTLDNGIGCNRSSDVPTQTLGRPLVTEIRSFFEHRGCSVTFLGFVSSRAFFFCHYEGTMVQSAGSHYRVRKRTHSCWLGEVPIPTSQKYPTAYMAFARPPSAARFAHKNASVSDCGSTPGEPTRYQAVNAKHASR